VPEESSVRVKSNQVYIEDRLAVTLDERRRFERAAEKLKKELRGKR
jgi:hypothetical protein